MNPPPPLLFQILIGGVEMLYDTQQMASPFSLTPFPHYTEPPLSSLTCPPPSPPDISDSLSPFLHHMQYIDLLFLLSFASFHRPLISTTHFPLSTPPLSFSDLPPMTPWCLSVLKSWLHLWHVYIYMYYIDLMAPIRNLNFEYLPSILSCCIKFVA